MTTDFRVRLEELAENPTPRLPVCLVLDTSGSMMNGQAITELNVAVNEFYDAIRQDDMARYAAEIAVVTFGAAVETCVDFSSIDRQTVPTFVASGATPMGEAVNRALDMLAAAKEAYSKTGVDYYQPWLVLMTDGAPTDDISSAVARCRDLANKGKLTLYPVAIGREANLNSLLQFSGDIEPLRIESARFRDFFKWLAKSTRKVSASNPGDSGTNRQMIKSFRELMTHDF